MKVNFIDTPYLVAIAVTFNPENDQIEGPHHMILTCHPQNWV